jgi:hypothetical protein
VGLKIEPDFGGPLEIPGEAQGGVRGDGALSFDDLIDAARGNADVLRNAVFGQSQWQEEVFAENFSGVNGGVLFHGGSGLMEVNNFNGVRSVCLPTETDTPLVVDADGVLAFAVGFEGFQSIAERNAKLIKFCDGVKLGELAQGGALNVRWEVADFLQPEQAGGGARGELV